MHSPPSSSDMFLSPPLFGKGSIPEEEVQKLFAVAQRVTSIDPDLFAIVSLHRETFLGAFGRQVELLKSRSQAFEDAHITVYDKVLLLLTDNGNQLETPAAIIWYCKEHLGYNLDDTSGRGRQRIEQSFAAVSALSQALSPVIAQREDYSPSIRFTHVTDRSQEKPTHSDDDPKFKHLWSVYNKAYKDYLILADKRDNDTLGAAKFLRDTAENGIHFLERQYPSDSKLLELTNTYNMAKSVAVALNGGKKRKFDRAVDQDYKPSSPKGRSLSAAEHNRIHTTRRHREKYRGKSRHCGRGPSGIPYGYTRPVDSYYPA